MSLLIIGVVLSFVAAISWGINAHIVRKGMIDENPFYALFLRSLFTAPILFLIVFIWKGLNGILVYLEPEIIIYVLISAMLIIIGDSIFMYTLKHYPVNLIQPIVSVYPLFTTFMLIISKTEEIKPTIILGTIIIILGVITITGGDISGTYSHKALMLGLTAAACWGISVYLVKLILLDGRTDAMGVTGIRILIIGIFGLIVFYSSKNARIERSKRSNISKHNRWIIHNFFEMLFCHIDEFSMPSGYFCFCLISARNNFNSF